MESLEGRSCSAGREPVGRHTPGACFLHHGSADIVNNRCVGVKVTFSASVENANTDSPIFRQDRLRGRAPQKIVLGKVNVNKLGQASVSTDQLTRIANYQVKARVYSEQTTIAAERGGPVTVK